MASRLGNFGLSWCDETNFKSIESLRNSRHHRDFISLEQHGQPLPFEYNSYGKRVESINDSNFFYIEPIDKGLLNFPDQLSTSNIDYKYVPSGFGNDTWNGNVQQRLRAPNIGGNGGASCR